MVWYLKKEFVFKNEFKKVSLVTRISFESNLLGKKSYKTKKNKTKWNKLNFFKNQLIFGATDLVSFLILNEVVSLWKGIP